MECITIKDVARVCGVGVSTVSRAINNHPDINPETKEMIMQVIKENNYVPNNSARNLKRSDARAIAILIKGISNQFFNSMIKVFEEEIQKKKDAQLRYELIGESGPDHNKQFTVDAYLNDVLIGSGTGRTKKAAEQQAAYEALLKMKGKYRKQS